MAKYKMVYPSESPCGCGSGKEFGKCCLKDGHINVDPKSTEPPAPITGNQHKKCALGWTHNCSSKLTGDHFVSKAVLKVLGGKNVTLSTKEFERKHSLNSSSLTTRRLCSRHNSALSAIDSEAARFFSAFADIHSALNGTGTSQKLYFFNGIDIDRWLIKTMLMVYYAKLSNITPDEYGLPDYARQLFSVDLRKPYGIYIPTSDSSGMKESFSTENAVSVRIHTTGVTVAGVTVTLGGLSLTLMLFGNPEDSELTNTHTYRPKNLLFFKGEEVYCISMVYPNWNGKDIWISHGEPDAEIPVS